MDKSAVLSECATYRYELRRVWDSSKPTVLFIGLNPSTADGDQDDRTLETCVRYAKSWGYGGVVIGNLFAFRSPYPEFLLETDDPIGPENDQYLARLISESAEVVCAWGEHGTYRNRYQEVIVMIEEPKCLLKLKHGQPGHPLYKDGSLVPVPYVL